MRYSIVLCAPSFCLFVGTCGAREAFQVHRQLHHHAAGRRRAPHCCGRCVGCQKRRDVQNGMGEQEYPLHCNCFRIGHDAKPAGDGGIADTRAYCQHISLSAACAVGYSDSDQASWPARPFDASMWAFGISTGNDIVANSRVHHGVDEGAVVNESQSVWLKLSEQLLDSLGCQWAGS